MATLTVEVVHLDEALAKLAKLSSTAAALAGAAAYHEAEYELPITQTFVPIKTGELQKSGRVEDLQSSGDTVTASIAYGGPAGAGNNEVDVDYAIIVHEDLAAHHVIGRAKYVESVVRDEMGSGRALARMAAEIDRGLTLLEYGGTSMGGFANRSGSWVRGTQGRFVGSTPGGHE